MSYCRWSCDNGASDIYCYASVFGGWTIHVATNKTVETAPPMPPFPMDKDDAKIQEWMTAHRAHMEWSGSVGRVPIGLPHDGKSFDEPTAQAALDRLLMLREVGYHVPQHAIDQLAEEAADGKC